ncbi:PGF-pre-PGF domain-containing protein [Methanofollis formosanus]|uniref:PGF-pre-PGF domain-containing protein n=1 Tax=Methanofollis formosanus TaxID=299308 RepID=A0A8G1A455_9EURY|nr:right-handed parallel beta-helix repeat-containing protein [Methanofollis formosanus]QYZ80088.1 PGF-pre-PGF domain-containing protein [Methanofollis formosanus]
MNKNPPFRKNVALFIVLLTVLLCLVLPVAGGEEDARPPETIAPPEPPLNITNATAPVLDLSVAADPPTGPVPLTVRFTSAAKGLAVDLWTWTVDGVAVVGNGSDFTHTFHTPGTHVVGLTAVNESAAVTNTSSVDINVTAAAPAPAAVVRADGAGAGHPRDWYVSPVPGTGNVTGLLNITDLGAGDTVHIWGAAGHTYEGGIVIDTPNVTMKRWEGSPVQPLITSTSGTSAFTVTADNATFRGLNISGNHLNYDSSLGAGINATGSLENHLKRLTITNCTFAGNTVIGRNTRGGALYAKYVADLLVEGTAFTGNSAGHNGGGACFWSSNDATLANTTFTGNNAICCGGAWFYFCDAATLTNATFTGNNAQYAAGGAGFDMCNAATLTNATFTGNNAQYAAGGAEFRDSKNATLTGTTFTHNTAGNSGGGASFSGCYAATITGTTFTDNTASDGGGACFRSCDDATVTNCRFDNPTNIYAYNSTAALNTARTSGTNIAGGPYLGGNLWLNDPGQNISERGADADFDGICDDPQNTELGTDHLPLMHSGGTVQINATPSGGAFVFVNGTNTTRTADNPFYLPVGNHTISVQKEGFFTGERTITVAPAGNEPLDFTLIESKHPIDWYVSKISGNLNVTDISEIPEIGQGDTIHIWGEARYTYEGGITIDAPNVTVKRWEGSPAQPLITSTSGTSAFTVTADNATFRDLNISGNHLNFDYSRGAGINATGLDTSHIQRLTVADCTFTENAVEGTSAYGGALSARYVDDLLVAGTKFTGNTARRGGGAVFTDSHNATLTATTFTNNTAPVGGGAYFLECMNATITTTTITHNTAGNSGGGALFDTCDAATFTNTTITHNTATNGGGAYFDSCDAATFTTTTFTHNTAQHGGGALFDTCDAATFTNTTITHNTAQHGGGAYFGGCENATFTNTTITHNTANNGGGAYFYDSANATITNCRFDNPTNIYAMDSSATLNTARTRGTNIAGGPYLGGNLWLSQQGKDADFDGICDDPQNTELGTDHLPLMHGGGTVQINATPADAFVYVDGTNTTRTANNPFYLPVGNRTVSVQKEGSFTGEQTITVTAGANDPLTFDLMESTHPIDWYVSKISGNFSSLQEIPEIGEGNTIHVWGVEGHTYEGGIVIDKPNVTVKRWEGSPVQPLITNRSGTSAFTVTADNATFLDLNISNNHLNYDKSRGAGIDAIGTQGDPLQRLTITNCTFAGNTVTDTVTGTDTYGGALYAEYVADLLVEGTAFTGNKADAGGGADFDHCDAATITGTTFTRNTAEDGCGGGACFRSCDDATITNCRFDNPTNIYAIGSSAAALNGTYTPGTNIAGGPYLGGNLWLNDPAQNISEWCADDDCDGICDQPLTIDGLGTDHLPLADGGNRGTVLVRASAHGGFVYVDGINTTRTADHFPAPAPVRAASYCIPGPHAADAFFLPAGNHTLEIVGPTTYGRATLNLTAGTTEPVIVEIGEVDIRGYARPSQGFAPLNVSFDTGFTDPEPDRHTWTFGDGNESSPCYWPSHTYEKAGRYTATLMAGWGEGSDLVTLVRTVNVTAGMPAPVLHLTAAEGNAPFTVGVNVSGAGMPERWHLDLGDGRAVEGTSPAEINRSVTYEKAGTYPLTLTVSTGEFTNATTGTVTVLEPPATPSSESNSGQSPISAASAASIPAGESASMKTRGAAISGVRVTAAETIPKIMITVEKTVCPSGVDAPAGSVYEYDDVKLYHTTEDAVEGALFLFSVPKTWLEEHGLEPADVVLYRYDDAWHPLPTEVDGEDETSWHFSAKSPGFFLFAIGGEPSAVSTPVMTPAAAAETVETLPPPPAAGTATPTKTEPPFPTMLLVVGGAVALLLAAFAAWRMR